MAIYNPTLIKNASQALGKAIQEHALKRNPAAVQPYSFPDSELEDLVSRAVLNYGISARKARELLDHLKNVKYFSSEVD